LFSNTLVNVTIVVHELEYLLVVLDLLLEIFLIQQNVDLFDIPGVAGVAVEEQLLSLPLNCHFVHEFIQNGLGLLRNKV
jgi:hypothetical protein